MHVKTVDIRYPRQPWISDVHTRAIFRYSRYTGFTKVGYYPPVRHGADGRIIKSALFLAQSIMCHCEFASAGGGVFIALAVLAVLNVLGQTPAESILGNWWWVDTAEIIFSAILGSILIAASRTPPSIERPVILFTGWLLIALAGLGLFREQVFFMHIERPLQIIFYFVMGIWALLAGLCKDAEEINGDVSSSGY